MFHQVKILDSKGKVKKVLSPKKLSKHYWGEFFDPAKNTRTKSVKRKKSKPGKTQKADLSHKDLHCS